jgi:hypothetical protein
MSYLYEVYEKPEGEWSVSCPVCLYSITRKVPLFPDTCQTRGLPAR